MELRTTSRDVAGQRVLALDGAVDLASTPQLHGALQRLLERTGGATSVVVDLDGATVIDDTALGLLLGAAATAREHDMQLRVVCTSERVRRRLAETRFDRAVTVVGSIAEPMTTDDDGVS